MNKLGHMFSRALLVGSLTLSAGCQPNFEIFTANEFADLGADSYRYKQRAATPDGLVVAVRENRYESGQGDLEFWAKAIENEVRLDQGYALISRDEFVTKKGVPGVKLRFGVDREEVAHEYLVAVYVVEKDPALASPFIRVFTVEAGGREELVERHRAQLDWTFEEFIAR